jgi:hypothetical protein
METNVKIEIFKGIQRVVMVLLTGVLIYCMYGVGIEIKEMRKELIKANATITEMAKSAAGVAKEIDDLEKAISNNWIYKLFGGKK